jgi:hypothetical protein
VLCATPTAAQAGSSRALGDQLARHVATMKQSTTVIHFFERHHWLLRDPRYAQEASVRLRIARRTLAVTTRNARQAREERARRRATDQRRHLQAALRRSPRKAICHVFGSYCREALRVARCESGYRVTAQNGEYLGLFQMGAAPRRVFGHGESALEQAQAAYRYFVRSGRDWSPWSCKPWY